MIHYFSFTGNVDGGHITISTVVMWHIRVNSWCDVWGMKLNASNTKTMIVSRSRIMHPQPPPLTIDGTVLKESDDLDIVGVTF